MPHYIVKLGTKYVEWSTIVDAPVTYGMTREGLKNYLFERYGEDGARTFDERMARVDKNGTSAKPDCTVQELVEYNRAGPRESCLTLAQLIEAAENDG